MKLLTERPLLSFALAFLLGILAALQLDALEHIVNGPYSLVILLAAAALWIAMKKRFFLPLILVIGLTAGCIWGAFYHAQFVRPVMKLHDRTVEISATVMNVPTVYEKNQRAELRIETVDSVKEHPQHTFRAMAYLPLTDTPVRPGDRVTGSFSFYQNEVCDGFQSADYYASKNFFILAKYVDEGDEPRVFCRIEPCEKTPFWALPLNWAAVMKQKLDSRLDTRTSAFLKALLFGDKSSLSDLDEQAMRKVGLSHVIAVSGMHIGFLVSFICLCFSRRVGMLLSVLAICVFIPMAGFTPSVVRAGVMYAVMAIGFLLKRENDGLTSMALALVLLLVQNPYAVFSLSLQLSFLATLGLLLYADKLQKSLYAHSFAKLPKKRLLQKAGRAICSTISCSLCAMLFTTPVLLASFGYLSLLSLLANLATISIFAVLFVLGMIFCILPAIPVVISVIGMIMTGICRYCFAVTGLIGKLRFFLLYWDAPYVKLAVVLVYGLVLISLYKPRLTRGTLPAVCFVLAAVCALNIHSEQTQRRITLLPSGSGQAIAVSNGHRELLMIDCAGSGHRNAAQLMQNYMDWNGFDKIDLLILTAMDQTHARNTVELLDTVPVGRIIIPVNGKNGDLQTEIETAAEQVGCVIEIWENADEARLPNFKTPVSLIGTVPGKLAVRIGDGKENDLLILHSLTQKMLEDFLMRSPTQAREIVLSASNISDPKRLETALLILSPERIYLQSAQTAAARLDGIPAYNTFETGEICLKYPIISVKEG